MKTKAFVRWAKPEDLERVQTIWTYAFADSPAFVDWAFTHYVQREEAVVAGYDDQIYASLQVIDYPLATMDGYLKARYVVGVDCLPEARGQGLTQAMMTYIHESAETMDVDLFLLMPFEASFYHAYDYVFGSFHSRANISMDQWPKEACSEGCFSRNSLRLGMADTLEGDLNALYETWQAQRFDFYQVRDKRQWQAFVDDLALEGGYLVFWTPEGGKEPEGYLAYTLQEEAIVLRELATTSEAARRSLYYYVAGHRSQKKRVHWSAPLDEPLVSLRPGDKESVLLYPFMMFRLQNVAKMTAFATSLPDKDLFFAVEGVSYVWKKGSRRVEVLPEALVGEVVLSLKDLNHLLFSPVTYVADHPGVRDIKRCFKGLSNYLNSYF